MKYCTFIENLFYHRKYSLWSNMPVHFIILILFFFVTSALTDGSTIDVQDPNALYDIVVQGIIENCRKFECGVLTWQTEQETHEQDRDYGLQCTCRMCWDREKISTRTMEITWNGQKSSKGKGTTMIKVYDGNEYRERNIDVAQIALAKKVHFNQLENYFECYGWPGHKKSIVDKLTNDVNNSRIIMEWSIVKRDAAKKIRLKRRKKDGANLYSIYYFDPEKNFMLVEYEFYNKNKLVNSIKWSLEEVSLGMWFPVEANQYGIINKPDGTGSTYTTNYIVDADKSVFNDRSAIPEGTFTLEITPDIDKILDYRFGEQPIVYDRTAFENLAMEELDKAAKDFLNEEPSKSNTEGTDDILVDEQAGQMNSIDSNEPSSDLLLQVDKNDKKTGLLQWLLLSAGIVLIAFGIVRWKCIQHSNK